MKLLQDYFKPMAASEKSTKLHEKMIKTVGNQIKRDVRNREKSATKSCAETFIYSVEEEDATHFYFLIFGLDDEFKGGEYIFEFRLPDSFPDSPPHRLKFLTPNGVFDVNSSICISIGEFHRNESAKVMNDGAIVGWIKGIGLFGFAKQIVNSMICWQGNHGIGYHGDQYSSSQRILYASESRAFNQKHYPKIMALFDDYLDNFPNHWESKNLINIRNPPSLKPAEETTTEKVSELDSIIADLNKIDISKRGTAEEK